VAVEFSDQAEGELEHIADYIAKDNPSRALSAVQELRSKCEALADSPLAFPLVPRYEIYGIRRRVYGNYCIFYQLDGGQIFVIHVLHGAQDYEAILS
jgi:toxin ParE1/3/4